MNRYIWENKVIYQSENIEPVVLRQYIISRDETKEEKFVILHYFNNVSEILCAMRFEIIQYNSKGEQIQKAEYYYNDFLVKPRSQFVPYAKIMLDNRCTSIQTKLISAQYELHNWKNGEWEHHETPKIDEQEQKVSDEVAIKEEENKEPKRIIKKTRLGKKGFRIPYFLSLLIVALIIVFTIITIHLHYQKRIESAGSHFLIEEVSEGVRILQYYGANKDVVIPSFIRGKPVIEIGPNAFENNLITAVTIRATEIVISPFAFSNCMQLKSVVGNSVTIIDQHAFSNCVNLSKVEFNEIGVIREKAFYRCKKLRSFVNYSDVLINGRVFEGCTSLTNVYLPNGVIAAEAFLGNTSIKTLEFGNCDLTHLGRLFGATNENVPKSLKVLSIGIDVINKDFLEGLSQIEQITFFNAESVVIEHGALRDCSIPNYYYDDSTEVINNSLLSIASGTVELYVPDSINHIFVNAFNGVGTTLERIIIENASVHLTDSHFSDCLVMHSIYLGPNVTVESGVFEPIRNTLLSVEMPILGNSFRDLFDYLTFIVRDITIVGTNNVPANYFAQSHSVEQININNSIKTIGLNAFDSCTALTKLSLPNYMPLDYYGSFPNLQELIIYENNDLTYLSEDLINGFEHLRVVTLPNNIVHCERLIIRNCPSLVELTIPSSVISMDMPIIDNQCINLKYVTLPFIGYSSQYPIEYAQLNMSYSYTNELTITEESAIDQSTFDFPYHSIVKLTISQPLTGNVNGIFRNLINLSYLEMKGTPFNYLGALFSDGAINISNHHLYVPNSLHTVVLRDYTLIPSFRNCRQLENVFLFDIIHTYTDVFDNCVSLRNIYLASNVQLVNIEPSLDTITLNGVLNVIYEGEGTYLFSNPNIVPYYNIDHHTHGYTVLFEGELIPYRGLLITDVDRIFQQDGYSIESIIFYYNQTYSMNVDLPYFGQAGSILFALRFE